MLDLLVDPNAWIALATLTALEIVLGIDNIIFISILVSRLEKKRQTLARQIGLSLALGFRVLFLFTLTWIIGLTAPVFSALGIDFSWRDIILFSGGLFLFVKAIHEIYNEIVGHEVTNETSTVSSVGTAFSRIIFQIVLIDIVFSVDSIITAVGMSNQLPVMITAVVISIIVMYVASGPIAGFVSKHPTTKMLALAFLIMIGVILMVDGFHYHIPRAYIYSSMAFATMVEALNVWAKIRRERRVKAH